MKNDITSSGTADWETIKVGVRGVHQYMGVVQDRRGIVLLVLMAHATTRRLFVKKSQSFSFRSLYMGLKRVKILTIFTRVVTAHGLDTHGLQRPQSNTLPPPPPAAGHPIFRNPRLTEKSKLPSMDPNSVSNDE